MLIFCNNNTVKSLNLNYVFKVFPNPACMSTRSPSVAECRYKNKKVFRDYSLNNTFAKRAVDCCRGMIEAIDLKTQTRQSTAYSSWEESQGSSGQTRAWISTFHIICMRISPITSNQVFLGLHLSFGIAPSTSIYTHFLTQSSLFSSSHGQTTSSCFSAEYFQKPLCSSYQ